MDTSNDFQNPHQDPKEVNRTSDGVSLDEKNGWNPKDDGQLEENGDGKARKLGMKAKSIDSRQTKIPGPWGFKKKASGNNISLKRVVDEGKKWEQSESGPKLSMARVQRTQRKPKGKDRHRTKVASEKTQFQSEVKESKSWPKRLKQRPILQQTQIRDEPWHFKKSPKAKLRIAKKAEDVGNHNGAADAPGMSSITNDAYRKPSKSVNRMHGRMEEEEWHQEHEFENEVQKPSSKESLRSKSPAKDRIGDKLDGKRHTVEHQKKLTEPKHHPRKVKKDDMRPREVGSKGKLRSQTRRRQHRKNQKGHVHRVRNKIKRDNPDKRRQKDIGKAGKHSKVPILQTGKTPNKHHKSVRDDALRHKRRKKTRRLRRHKDGNGNGSRQKRQNKNDPSSRPLSKTTTRRRVKGGKSLSQSKKKQRKAKGRIKRRKKTMLSRRRKTSAASSTTKSQTSKDEMFQRRKGRSSLKQRHRKGILKPKQHLKSKRPAKPRRKSTSRPRRQQKKRKRNQRKPRSKRRQNGYNPMGRSKSSVPTRELKKHARSSSSTSDTSFKRRPVPLRRRPKKRPQKSRKSKKCPMKQRGLEEYILTTEPRLAKPTTTTSVVPKTTTPPRVPESTPNDSPFQIPMMVAPVTKERLAKKSINAKEPLETGKPIVKESPVEEPIAKWPPVKDPTLKDSLVVEEPIAKWPPVKNGIVKEDPEEIPIMKESMPNKKPIISETPEVEQSLAPKERGAEAEVEGDIVRSDKEGSDHIDRRKDSMKYSLREAT